MMMMTNRLWTRVWAVEAYVIYRVTQKVSHYD